MNPLYDLRYNFHPAHRGDKQMNDDQQLSRCESAMSDAVHAGAVPEKNGAHLSIQTEWAGRLYRKPYHDDLDRRRKDPANCGRCGKPNDNGYRQCDSCRAYLAEYRKAKHSQQITVDAKLLDRLRHRVASLEISVARLQLDGRSKYQRGYNAGLKQQAARKYFDAYQSISKQELATINHAYDNNE